MVVLMLLCFSGLLGEMLKPLYKSQGIIKYYLLTFSLIFLIYERKDSLVARYINKNNTFYYFKKIEISSYDKIYVDRWESPGIRYLFEYGQLKSEIGKSYPVRFTFIKYERQDLYEWEESNVDYYSRQPKMNELTDYDLLITNPELFKQGNSDKWTLVNGTTNFYIQKHNQSNE
jgi:hypothetical protein